MTQDGAASEVAIAGTVACGPSGRWEDSGALVLAGLEEGSQEGVLGVFMAEVLEVFTEGGSIARCLWGGTLPSPCCLLIEIVGLAKRRMAPGR
ncbi:hypothetical protein MPNT_230002 [Candidatus Methylacidithermus pantelleriae]|uniref:Uncharacterized protein n=1 Tax=Candidatus Methylacidithermus pantelleriae TaxID=2744239 RepID=A0A8J2BN08_9BACT|nr:hypothetical protein MPNT_230002 [Candidatus Methylacidithermus pantelleriae]